MKEGPLVLLPAEIRVELLLAAVRWEELLSPIVSDPVAAGGGASRACNKGLEVVGNSPY